MSALRVFAVAAGALLAAIDMWDLLRALVVPRSIKWRPVTYVSVLARKLTHAVAVHISPYEIRDRFLASSEPLIVLLRLAAWLTVGLFAFALMIWGLNTISLNSAFVISGSSIFTLGFATQAHTTSEVVEFTASAFGLVIVALQIAYLPTLYNAYNRRETLVTMLESRAGSPAWGPELLARHYLVGIQGNLPQLFRDWEGWCADVSESHTAYPSLLHLRSPRPTNSWIVGLIAVLDAGALYLSLMPSIAPPEARLCMRMGFTGLRDIASVMRIQFDPDPMPDSPLSLSYDEFLDAVKRLGEAGLPLERDPEDAWPQFRGWRVNYEHIGYKVAEAVFAPPAPWTGSRRVVDPEIAPKRPVDRRPDAPQGDPV